MPNTYQKPTVLDLFSGAGGTGWGFKAAGFTIVGAIENHLSAAATYEENLGVRVIKRDISEISPGLLRRRLKLDRGDLDILVGCPPCQGFSRMRNSNGAEDKRNLLGLTYLQFVKVFLPRFVLFENVPGLIRTPHGRVVHDKLISGLKALGYAIVEQQVDVASYGVAQRRRRVIIIAGRGGEEPPFPQATHGKPNSREVRRGMLAPWRTVCDAIGNDKYPELQAGEDGEQAGRYPNHVASSTGEEVLAFIRRVPTNGGSRKDVPQEYWLACHQAHDGHTDVYGRLAWDKPAGTITSGCTNPSKGRFAHPEQDRALTPREAAALQGFSDDFIFYGSEVALQIGNAVPPPLAYALAEALKKRLLECLKTRPRLRRFGKSWVNVPNRK